MIDRFGIDPKSGCELMAKRSGEHENLEFTNIDFKNYL